MSDSILAIIINLISSFIAASLGFLTRDMIHRSQAGHVRKFIGASKTIKIVFPSIGTPTFPKDSIASTATIPDNIPLMPMAEGKAIANIVFLLRSVRKNIQINYMTASEFVDDGSPFISIGGPSVNRVSGDVLSYRAPFFKLVYPDHHALLNGEAIRVRIDNTTLEDDYGFLLVTRSRIDSPSIVLCGVWATGTEIASLMFCRPCCVVSGRKFRRDLKSGRELFAASHAEVAGYKVGNPTLIDFRRI